METFELGDLIWRPGGTANSEREPARIESVTANGFRSVHVTNVTHVKRHVRCGNGMVKGVSKMSAEDAGRVRDLEMWRRLKYVHPEHDYREVRVTKCRLHSGTITDATINDVIADLETASALLSREAKRGTP